MNFLNSILDFLPANEEQYIRYTDDNGNGHSLDLQIIDENAGELYLSNISNEGSHTVLRLTWDENAVGMESEDGVSIEQSVAEDILTSHKEWIQAAYSKLGQA